MVQAAKQDTIEELALRLYRSSNALMVQAAEQDMVAVLTNLDRLGNTHHDGSMEPACWPAPEVCQAAA